MYIQLDDLKMYYADNQLNDRPVIVFIHGLGENMDSWQNQIDYFNPDYRVIVMDLRGHGRSDDGTQDITITQFAKDVAALLDALQITKAHIVGLSMGGMIALELAINYAKRLLTVSLCHTASFFPEKIKAQLAGRVKMIKTLTMDEMANFIVTACLPEKYDPKIYVQAFNIFRHNRLKPYLAATIATYSIDFRKDLGKIKLPTLVVTGEFDKATPLEASEYIHQAISGSELYLIKGAGHLSKLEKPDEFNRLIEGFICQRI